MPRDAFCNSCGTKLVDATYPRKCSACGLEIWANPIPVAVALVPVGNGLLAVRRGIPPGVGKLALVGGFIEEHEPWQVALAREVREETAVVVDPESVTLLWVASSAPKPNRVLIFGVTAPVVELPAFVANHETQERGVIHGPGGLDDAFAFSLHAEAARRYFASRSVDGPHAFVGR